MATEKSKDTTTIEVSMEICNKLHSLSRILEKILRKRRVSIDQTLQVLLAIKPLDIVLQDMMLEEGIEHAK